MSNLKFYDHIAGVLASSLEGSTQEMWGAADDVLAMPEMQAIRRVLRELTTQYHFASARAVLMCQPFSLPVHVIDWVLADD